MNRKRESSNVERGVVVGAMVGNAQRRAEDFPLDNGELRSLLLEQRQTFEDIARTVLHHDYDDNSKLAQMTVSYRARMVLSDQEYEEVQQRNMKVGCRRGGLAFHPVTLEHKPAEAYTHPENGRKVDWTPDEISRLITLVDQYRYNGGMHDGHPCFTLIAQNFPGRSANACARRYGRYLKKLEGNGNGDLQ